MNGYNLLKYIMKITPKHSNKINCKSNFELSILKYVFYDIIRSKWLIIYTLALLITSSGLIYFSHDETKSIASILNIVLILVPLISIIFASMHFYNSKEFIQMLLTQPVKRNTIFKTEYLGISFSLSLGFIIGTIFPLSFYGLSKPIFFLLISGVFLSFIFTAIAFLFSILIDEKLKGMGILLFLWLFFSILYDGLILILYFTFSDYPLEKFTIFMTLLNPIDISRILILLNIDLSALFGFSGAIFIKFFNSYLGIIVTLLSLCIWTLIPIYLARKKFMRKNF